MLTSLLQLVSVILSVYGCSSVTGEQASVSVFRRSPATSASDAPAFVESCPIVNSVESAIKAGNAFLESWKVNLVLQFYALETIAEI